MHPYLPHLLDDILAAHRQEVPHEARVTSLEEHFEEVERWISGEEPEHTFGYHCGLKAEDFPPPKQLTSVDMRKVCKAFEKMMYTWNMGVSFPKLLPMPIYYKFLVNTLNEKTGIVNSGTLSFDYCSGSPDVCIFKEYCSCLQYSDDWVDYKPPDLAGDEQPF